MFFKDIFGKSLFHCWFFVSSDLLGKIMTMMVCVQVFCLHFPSPMRLIQSSVQLTTFRALNLPVKPSAQKIKKNKKSLVTWNMTLENSNLAVGLPSLKVMRQASAWLVDPGQWLVWRLIVRQRHRSVGRQSKLRARLQRPAAPGEGAHGTVVPR